MTRGRVQQIADWLEKLGMSEYAARFVENDIDASILRDLTDQDIKELGVSLGHRQLSDDWRCGLAMFAHGLRCADLVLAHQARIADDVGG
jgi:hypothetical protein